MDSTVSTGAAALMAVRVLLVGLQLSLKNTDQLMNISLEMFILLVAMFPQWEIWYEIE